MKSLDKYKFKGPAIYDWAKLLDGGIYELTHGIDFNCAVKSFIELARAKARRQLCTLRIAANTDANAPAVIIQATPMPAKKATAVAKAVASAKKLKWKKALAQRCRAAIAKFRTKNVPDRTEG